jgi:signal transduction histidine kinase
MINTLKFKIIITAFILISIIMVGNTWKDIILTEKKLLNAQKEKTVLLSDRISHGIMVLMLKNRWQDLQGMMESLIKDGKELKEIRVFSPDTGNIVVSSDPEDIGKRIYKEDLDKYKNGEYAAFLINKEGSLYSSKLTPIENHEVCHRCHAPEKEILGIMDVEISLETVFETIEKFKKEHLTDALIGFVLILFTFLVIVGVLIDRPIHKMINTIKRIEMGDLSARMNINKKDELGLLAKTFDKMVESLESAKKEIEVYHEQQIERSARLASIGEVASGIAHEIKNPLTGISCAMQVLQTELSEDDSRRTVISEILNEVKRLDGIVKDLLTYAKPKPPQFLPSKVYDIIEKAKAFVYPEAKKLNIAIETYIEKDIPEIMMDPDQIMQVFLNMMVNAVQAMSAGGKLVVSIFQSKYQDIKDEIRRDLGCDQVLVARFQDTGKGISPEDMKSIFEPFFTNKSKGTGLGLSISKGIVREHGGELTCNSEMHKGTVFTVYLPVRKWRADV